MAPSMLWEVLFPSHSRDGMEVAGLNVIKCNIAELKAECLWS